MKQRYLLCLLLLTPLLAHADGLKALGEAWALLAMLALGFAVLLLGTLFATLYRPQWRGLLALQVPIMLVFILLHGVASEGAQESPPFLTAMMQLSILLAGLTLARQVRQVFVRAVGVVAVIGSGFGLFVLFLGLFR